jgi:hypothetical protein
MRRGLASPYGRAKRLFICHFAIVKRRSMESVRQQVRAHNGAFELVWRTFANTMIHERIYAFWVSEADRCIGYADPVFDAGGVHYFSAADNRFYERGFPLPERRGDDAESETIRVFMDDLFLCPDCGSFQPPMRDLPDPEWIDSHKQRIDTDKLWRAIELRFDHAEFEIRRCPDRKRCRWIAESNRLRRYDEELNERRRLSAIRKADRIAKLEVEMVETRAVPRKLYVIGSDSHVKIGIARDVNKRLSMLQISSPVRLTVLRSWECDDAQIVERRLHKRYSKFKATGEWFALPEQTLKKLIATEGF